MNYELLREIMVARLKTFVFVAFLLLLNLTIWLYLSLWQRPELEKAQTDWFAKRNAAASGQSVLGADRYRAGMLDLAQFQKRLIPKKGFAGFLSELFETSRNNSLALKGITYKPSLIKEEGLVAYVISFTVAGKYASVKGFLADLARYNEMVTLDSVSLRNASSTEETVELKVQMTAYLKVEGA